MDLATEPDRTLGSDLLHVIRIISWALQARKASNGAVVKSLKSCRFQVEHYTSVLELRQEMSGMHVARIKNNIGSAHLLASRSATVVEYETRHELEYPLQRHAATIGQKLV